MFIFELQCLGRFPEGLLEFAHGGAVAVALSLKPTVRSSFKGRHWLDKVNSTDCTKPLGMLELFIRMVHH
jgi:hypothetical protein